MRIYTGTLLVATVLSVASCKPHDRQSTSVVADAAEATANPAAAATSPVAVDWCAGHKLPESKCTLCNPELIAQFKAAGDWCAAHGFPESACPKCNPVTPPTEQSAAKQPIDWCAGHKLPESKCTVCNPGLIAAFKAAGDWCDAHGFPESACPTCNPMASPDGELGAAATTRIRFRDPSIEVASGIEVVTVREESLAPAVECTARIEFDRNHVVDVRSPMPGVIKEVIVDLGQSVKAGTPLFRLASTEIGDVRAKLGSARQRVVAARSDHDRQQQLSQPRIASTRQVEVARQELEVAEAELRALESTLAIAGANGSSRGGSYQINAPRAGTIVHRPAMTGLFASAETSLATIVDLSTVWAMLDIRERDASDLAVGQAVTVQIDGRRERSFAGKITWISAEVDAHTRTVSARAEIPNPDGRLRANQFARATVHGPQGHHAVAVPRSSVQRLGDEHVVFVRTSPGVYEPRTVTLGRVEREQVQVDGPIRAGDQVVHVGAFLLKTELSKDRIGAGCCEVDQK